jgi:hypothetical protein
MKLAKTTSVQTPATFYLIQFLAPKQQDCQENDGNDNANVGARSTIICQNEKDDGSSQNVLSRCFVTEFSSDQRKACVFPFKLREGATEEQNSCTDLSDPDGKYWCSTKVCKYHTVIKVATSFKPPSIFPNFSSIQQKHFKAFPNDAISSLITRIALICVLDFFNL